MANVVHFKIGPKLPLRIAILVILGVAVFSILNFSLSYFDKRASSGDQETSEDELYLSKRDHASDEEEDMHFHWDYTYNTKVRTNPCSYFNDADPNTFFCVPHFLVLGCQCSGQDLLFYTLQLHQNISYSGPGHDFFSKFDNFEDFSLQDMTDYARLFDEEAKEIYKNSDLTVGDMGCYLVREYKFSESEHQDQPRRIAPMYLNHLNSNMKVFYTVRNPVDRFQCCWCRSTDQREVGEVVTAAIEKFKKCDFNSPTRKCTYVLDYLEGAEKCIAGGLTYIFYEDLLMYFHRPQIRFVHWQDIVRGDPLKQMEEYSTFLEIGDPGPEFLLAMATFQSGGKGCQREPMTLTTKQELHDFYDTFNEQMFIKADKDPKFLYPRPM